MLAPKYIQRELKAINPLYFAVFDSRPRFANMKVDKDGRWLIRKWKTTHPLQQRIENWKFMSLPILTIKNEDQNGRDIGYCQLDMRAIHTIKEGLYNARIAKTILAKIDEANDTMVAKEDEEYEYQLRAAAKRVWHRYREPTVFLGG